MVHFDLLLTELNLSGTLGLLKMVFIFTLSHRRGEESVNKETSMEENCPKTRRVIAQGPVCTVEQCTCGVLHVTLGALTIRLQMEVVASIHETLGEALRLLRRKDSVAPMTQFGLGAFSRPSTGRPS